MAMLNFNVLHLLYLFKEQMMHLHGGLSNCLMYFLKFENSVSVLTSSGRDFQMRGPRVVKLLSPCLSVLLEYTVMLDGLCVNHSLFWNIFFTSCEFK